MVRSHPQHQRSSPVGCFFKFSSRTSMDASGAEVTAAPAASPGAAEHERDSGELEAGPTTALASQPSAGGAAAASTEAVVESPPGVGRSGREPTARPRRSAVADPGKDLLDEIIALKDQQKKAKEEKGDHQGVAERQSSPPAVEEAGQGIERSRPPGGHFVTQPRKGFGPPAICRGG